MTTRDTHSVGAPCRVDTFQPDPRAAMDFIGPLFGWSFDEPTPMPAWLDGDYFAARLRGRPVAGIGPARHRRSPGRRGTPMCASMTSRRPSLAQCKREVRVSQDRLVSAQMAPLLCSQTP